MGARCLFLVGVAGCWLNFWPLSGRAVDGCACAMPFWFLPLGAPQLGWNPLVPGLGCILSSSMVGVLRLASGLGRLVGGASASHFGLEGVGSMGVSLFTHQGGSLLPHYSLARFAYPHAGARRSGTRSRGN